MVTLDYSFRALYGANSHASHSVLVGTFDWLGSRVSSATSTVDVDHRCQDLLAALSIDASRLFPIHSKGRYGLLAGDIARFLIVAQGASTNIDPASSTVDDSRQFVVPLEPEPLVWAACEMAARIVSMAVQTDETTEIGDLRTALTAVRDAARNVELPLQTGALADACRRRGIPWRRSSGGVQMGEGSLQCRFDLTVTSQTRRLATDLARDKVRSNALLARFGVPVARQVVVKDLQSVWSAAKEIGLPVVVKPRRGNMGRAVAVNLTEEQEVVSAAKRAQTVDRSVIVESFLPGMDHRILVAAGRVIGVTTRLPAHVVGDGVQTIQDLLASVNADPRRSNTYRTPLKRIRLDAESERLLAMRGYDTSSVPPAGEMVPLKSAANMSVGGTARDVTRLIHPDNAEMAVRAVELIGLDVAGVDVVTPDITRSCREMGGGLCEVNYRPGILGHLFADGVGDRDVAGELLDAVYPVERQGRIPTAVLVSSMSDDLAARMADVLDRRSLVVGVVGPSGIRIGSWTVTEDPRPTHIAHALVTEHPAVDAVILVTDPKDVTAHGVGVTRADVAVLDDYPSADDLEAPGYVTAVRRTGARVMSANDVDALVDAMMVGMSR